MAHPAIERDEDSAQDRRPVEFTGRHFATRTAPTPGMRGPGNIIDAHVRWNWRLCAPTRSSSGQRGTHAKVIRGHVSHHDLRRYFAMLLDAADNIFVSERLFVDPTEIDCGEARREI